MNSKKFQVSNTKFFLLFAFIVVIIIGLFVFFIVRFNNLDSNKYDIALGSMFYNDNYNYLTVESESYLTQRFDGNYYWYQKKDNKTTKEKVGQNPVVFNKSDYKVYLYGNAYQVLSTGEVKSISKQTEIAKASPTKFYKLKDRKYLMVDSNMRTSDKTIKTSGYLIIELDKQGNATFANNEINIKTIKPLILKGTTMNFDIANEKLIYGKKEINLKNIIGSTNDYKEATEDEKEDDTTKETITAKGDNKSDSSKSEDEEEDTTVYYDEYVKNVINSVNNLTNSITEVNAKNTSVKKDEIYYDFSKYVALKSVTSGVSTINVSYSVVDSNNEFQFVYVVLDDNAGKSETYYLNKNENSYVIRDLVPNHNYTLSFGYKIVTETEPAIDDVVNIRTKSPTCKIKVTKVSSGTVTYNLKIGSDYKFDSGIMSLYVDDTLVSSQVANMSTAAGTAGFTGGLSYHRLGSVNTLKLENIVYNGNNVNIDCSYRFVS